MKEIQITIIIPTYNRADLLLRTLESLRNQSIEKNLFEVIVVDDGSSDNTKEVVDSFNQHFLVQYFFQPDLGYRVASARNIGIKNSKGKIILFVDSGIILTRTCVEEHFNSHQKGPQKLVVLGYIFFLDDPDSEYKQQLLSQPGLEQSIELFIKNKEHLDYREPLYQACNDIITNLHSPWVLCWTGNVSMTAEMIKGSNHFDTNFDKNWGMEDIDLGFCLYKEGAAFTLNRKASSVHYPHLSNMSDKLTQEKTNKIYFHKKHNCLESQYLMDCSTIELNLRFDIKKGNADR